MTRPLRPPANVPAAIAAAGDANPTLARWKASLAKRWSLTRMGELFEAVELAWCFVALGRDGEAGDVVAALAAVLFRGDYNIWTPVGYGRCLRARLARLAGDTPGWDAALVPIRANPVNSPANPDGIRRLLAKLPAAIERGAGDRSLVYGRNQLATAAMEASYFQECGLAGIDHGVAYDPDALEPVLRSGLAALRARLEAGPRREGAR